MQHDVPEDQQHQEAPHDVQDMMEDMRSPAEAVAAAQAPEAGQLQPHGQVEVAKFFKIKNKNLMLG